MSEKVPPFVATSEKLGDVQSAIQLIQMMKREFKDIPSVNDIPEEGTLSTLLKEIMRWRLAHGEHSPETITSATLQFMQKELVTWDDYDAVSEFLAEELGKKRNANEEGDQ